jgi:branched-subunit amino acid ABC-type transport system permease component
MGDHEYPAFVIDGLLLGCVYGIAAMGLTLIWGVMNVINLSHGPIIALGMFGMYFLLSISVYIPTWRWVWSASPGRCWECYIRHRHSPGHQRASPVHAARDFSISMIIIGLGTTALTTSAYNVEFRWALTGWGRLPFRELVWWRPWHRLG